MNHVNVIAPRSGCAFVLKKGELLRVIDPLGGQVSDMLAFNLMNVKELISNGRTFDYEETIKLTKGNVIWSNQSRPMLEIVRDDVGSHDFLLTPCSVDTFKHFYPDKPLHRGCMGNLVDALKVYGIKEDDIPTAFNIFMNVPVDGDSGRLRVLKPLTNAGDCIEFRALMDVVIGLTACSAYASNGGVFKPIHYLIERGIKFAP